VNRPRVVLADDHSIVLEGLRRVLQADFIITATAKDGYDLLRLALLHKPDVIVSDLSMPGLTGLEVLQRIRAAKLRTKFIILTMHSDAEIAREACRKGASGFVLKASAASQLERAIRTALDGEVYIDPLLAPEGGLNFAAEKSGARTPSVSLTDREREVLKLVAEGRMLKEISGLLNISESTAGFHKYNMMRKLNLRSTATLTQHAIRTGLIGIDEVVATSC
jgi:DNA-binding NarL/FixJ family response regulator